jgi:hypothetical protein
MPICYAMICNPMHSNLAKFYYCKKWVLQWGQAPVAAKGKIRVAGTRLTSGGNGAVGADKWHSNLPYMGAHPRWKKS